MIFAADNDGICQYSEADNAKSAQNIRPQACAFVSLMVSGWGGLSNAFDGKNGFDAEARQLQALLDDAEYKAARANTS